MTVNRPVDQRPRAFAPTKARLVVVGNGMAGIRAVEEILGPRRRRDV